MLDNFVPEYIFTARKQSLRRLSFYTCLSFCPQGWEEYLGRYPRAGIPRGQVHPPWAGTPLGQVHPLGRYPWAGTPPWQVHPRGRYTPLGRYAWVGTPPGQVQSPGQEPPWAGSPPGQVHSPGQELPWAGSPLWAGTSPSAGTSPGQVHLIWPMSGTHSTGMHSCNWLS